MTKARQDYDSPWKDAIHQVFQDFLEFFYPEVHDDIDWSVPYRFLDQELRKVTRNSAQGNRRRDALVEVQSLSRGAQWLLIHIEIQSQHDAKLASRILLYNARARDHFAKTVVSFVILADPSKSWGPSNFKDEIWGFRLAIDFPMRKLVDYPASADSPSNPISWLVAAHHQARQTKADPDRRKTLKVRLLKGLLQCGLPKAKVVEQLRLVHWLVVGL